MVRRSDHGAKWRIRADATGAGTFVARGDHVLVGTDYGVQCLDLSGRERWRAELGARCLGVELGRGEEAVATCRNGLFVLDASGKRVWGTHSKKEIVHEPILFREGVVLCTVHTLHFLRDWNGAEWRFDLREALGSSVKTVRVVDGFEIDGSLVLGAVDYDSGIGRVVVLDEKGQKTWQSEPGPLSGLFPAGSAVFVWSLSGYGRFESHMARSDGKEIWKVDFAGIGAPHPDGTISMLVGSNESPTWDNWEYRRLTPSGRVERSLPARGHCPSRPLVASDGAAYFSGYFLPIDPNESRIDYTSFFPLPATLAFGHKTGMSVQPSHFHLWHLRAAGDELEVLGEVAGGVSFARPLEAGDSVIYCRQGELAAYPLREKRGD